METKICTKCNNEKPLTEFFKNGRGGYRCDCKVCSKNQIKIYRNENKEKIKKTSQKWLEKNVARHNQNSKNWYNKNVTKITEKRAEYREENREKLKLKARIYILENKDKHKERSKKYRINNKVKINEYTKKRLKYDPLFKLKLNVRTLINRSLKKLNYIKTEHTEKILGCSFDDFKLHLESNFESWMSWDNRGLYNGELNYGWDIDHIIPLSSAVTEDDVIRLNHYTNLQPLCSKINRDIKRDLIN